VLLALIALTAQCVAERFPERPHPSSVAASEKTAQPKNLEAAVVHHWGPVVAGDEFDYEGSPNPMKWTVYDSVGHNRNGLRKPSQIKVRAGRATIRGTADGTTGGMAAKFDRQRYGRWETRMRVADRNQAYHPVLSLWPDSDNWPCDGEINYAEATDDLASVSFFHHYSCANRKVSSRKALDLTQWHNYAVEWTNIGIVGYLDGVEWFRTTDASHQPPGPMHQTIQLDWFPGEITTKPTSMDVAWVRVYDIPSAAARTPVNAEVRLAAVGDMNPAKNTSRTSASAKVGASIASALAQRQVDAFFGLGDFQYSVARCADYVAYWRVLWGATKSKLFWVSAPNHDWQPGRNEDLDNFMNGQCPGDRSKSAINAERGFIGNGEPYAEQFGKWHIVFLSSALWRYDVDRATQVTTWLDQDLAAAQARGLHIAVVYHEPYFTSDTDTHSRASEQRPWIDVMYKYRVRFTLSGSQHNYERSCPVDNRDACVADGMTAFQVSTGGVPLREFTSDPPFIAKRFSDTHGWLELRLRDDGSFSWQYRSVDGPGADTGSRPPPK
jgi:hypothetical protein